jgi:ABC-type nitrate/sulfonate/bicarbonate transport system substrate-binding protein
MLLMKFSTSNISMAFVIAVVVAVFPHDDACVQKELTRIKVGYAAPSVDNVLIAVADKEGLFEKYGLKAELVGMRGGVQVMQGLVAGSIDFGQAGVPETVQAAVRGWTR